MVTTQLKHYYNSDDFYEEVRKQKSVMHSNEYALVSLDFDNFNYINDLFGYAKGDLVLKKIQECFDRNLEENEIFSRIHADHFYLWIKVSEKEVASRLLQITDSSDEMKKLLPLHYNMVCSGGIMVVQNRNESISALLDKANFARKEAKGNHSSNFLHYGSKLEEELEWKKLITVEMEEAISKQEFEMYLQPKVLMKTKQLIGAEALVRWNSKKYGMIYPDRFIPILEQNGFIREVDFFMLQQASSFLARCMEEGIPCLPISVNFSKVHLRAKDFAERIFQTIKKYEISPSLIEVELTESIFTDDFENLINITSNLKKLGFKVSLDDFGKAYSSLNYLKDVPLDIIKIDKDFLNATSDSHKGRVMIAKIIEMIKALHFTPIMEGVETEEQAEFLQKLNCNLGQGYLFSRPISVDTYVEFLENSKILDNIEEILQYKENIYTVPHEFEMDSWELYNLGQNIDMGLMKGYLDGEATVQYVNDKALEYLGYTRLEFSEIFHNSIAAFTHPDDIDSIQKNVEELILTGKPLEFQIRAIRKDGEIIILKGRVSCVLDLKGRPVGIYAFQDVTEEIAKKESLRISEERYKFIIEQSDDIVFEWNFENDRIIFSDRYKDVFGKESFEEDVQKNQFIRRTVHPEDRKKLEEWIEKTYKVDGATETELRAKTVNNNYIWIKIRSTAICNKSGEAIKAVGVFINITKQKEELEQLVKKMQLDPLTKFYNWDEMKKRVEDYLEQNNPNMAAFLIVDIDDFRGVNDNLGHLFGDTILSEIARKIKRIFKENDILGRVGGDEFGIFLTDIENEEELYQRAELLNQLLKGTYFGTHSKYRITVSIGIAKYPEDAKFFNTLYQMADVALLEAKQRGKDCFLLYNNSMEGKNREKMTPVEGEERFLNTYFAEDIIFNIFEMLYETKDIRTSIQAILERLGKRFQVDRVYIFEKSRDLTVMANTYEWCARGISAEKESLQGLSLDAFKEYYATYDKEGLLKCSDIRQMDQISFETLERQNIKAFLHCGIYEEGEIAGFVGFDDCSKNREWREDEIATLGYISRILSVFLIKQQTMEALTKSHRRYVEMLDNLNGHVYVINRDNYELLYLNKAMQTLGAKVGEKCHEVAFSSMTPCENCPVKRLTKEQPYATEEIYSVRVDVWVNSAASRVVWNGEKEAALVCCTDISKYK